MFSSFVLSWNFLFFMGKKERKQIYGCVYHQKERKEEKKLVRESSSGMFAAICEKSSESI